MGFSIVEFSSNVESKADAAPCGRELLAGPAGSFCAGATEGEGAGRARRLARLLESSTQPFAGLDLEGRIICLNRAFATLTGQTEPYQVDRSLGSIIPPRVLEPLADALDRVLATGEPVLFETVLLVGDGPEVPVEFVVELDADESTGVPVGFCTFAKDLTTRKKVLAALRDSDERFRRLYDEAPVGYHEVDTQGRIVNINRTECEILGYPRAEFIGRSYFDFLADEIREAAWAAFPDKINERRPLTRFERTVVTRDGRRLVIAIEERYQRDDEGRVIGLLSTVRDITDQKRAGEALVAAERRNRALFEGMDEAVIVHTPDGRIIDANPAASRLLGYSRDEMVGMTTADVDDPDFAAGFGDRLAEQMASGHLVCEGRHRTKDGRVIPVEINTSLIQYDDQPAVLAVLRNISERLALEETRRAFAEAQARNAREMAAKNAELTLSEARYRQLTEGCLDGVVVADRNGLVTLFNPAAERMFGYEAREVVGRHLGVLMPKAFPVETARSFEEDVLWRRPGIVGKTVELTARRKNAETFPIELSLSAVVRGGEPHFIGSIRDQTERQRMRAMLAQSERLASIGLLSAGVAHEINNPLAYVGNNLAVLERDLGSLLQMVELYQELDPVIRDASPGDAERIAALADDFDWPYVRENLPRMIARTREGVQRVANIVSNLRNLARTSPLKMETARIPELLDSVLEMLRGRLRRSRIEVVIDHGLVPPLVCVPTHISQVILNLMVNATQAVEAAGRPEGGTIRFGSRTEGDMVALSIADDGCGIAPEDLGRLFDPFFTTKSVGEGTGLGLTICHGLVTGHGGRIDVESRPGTGSTFRVLLPLKPS